MPAARETLSPQADRDIYRLMHAQSLVAAGQHARAVALARELVARQGRSDSDIYNLVCLYSLLSAAARKDGELAKDAQTKQAEEYAEAALELLVRLGRSGYFNDKARREHLAKDGDLAALRSRPGFRKLLSEVGDMGDPGPGSPQRKQG